MTLTVMFMEKNESSVKPNGCNLMKEACLIEPANWMTWLDGFGGSLEESKVRSLIPTNTNVNVKKQVDRSWRCLLLKIGIDRELWGNHRCLASSQCESGKQRDGYTERVPFTVIPSAL